MLPKKFIRGIADPVSLFALGFLVVSLFVGTFVVSNPNITLDIRERAREIEEDTLSVVRRTTPTKAPTKAPTRAPSKDTEDERAARKEEALEPDIPTSAPTAPTPTPYCSRFSQEDCTYGCEPTTSGGRCKSAPSATTAPTPTPYCSSFNKQDCAFGCEPTTSGGRCRSATSTPAPVATVTPYCSRFNQDDCLYGCEPDTSGGTCKTRTATPAPTTPLTPTPTPYCSRFYQEYCNYGCEATSNGGKCLIAPTATPSIGASPTPTSAPNLALKSVGQACSANSECESSNCQTSPGGKYCFPSGTAYTPPVAAVPTSTAAAEPQLSILQQVELAVAQTGLELITSFNQSGVAEHVQTQAQAISTDAQVIQTVISGEDLGASRWVNAGIAVYSALDILSRPLTLGGASLDDVRLAAVNWASANADANARGAGITDPYRLTSAAQAGLQGTALVTSVAGVAGFAPNQAANELFTNATYQRYVGQYTQRGYTAVGQVLERANTALGFVDDGQRLAAPLTSAADEATPLTQSLADDAVEGQGVFTLKSGEEIQIVQQIGAGAQGSAYLGRTCTGSRCVIKLFNEDTTGFEQLNASQMDILQTFATPDQIASTNLSTATFLGQGVDDAGRVGYALEYVNGKTLAEVIEAQGGSITSGQGQAIVDTATRYQQITGQPHGDLIQIDPYLGARISTGNIIVTPEGKAVLIDPLGAIYRPDLTTAQFMQTELETLTKVINWLME